MLQFKLTIAMVIIILGLCGIATIKLIYNNYNATIVNDKKTTIVPTIMPRHEVVSRGGVDRELHTTQPTASPTVTPTPTPTETPTTTIAPSQTPTKAPSKPVIVKKKVDMVESKKDEGESKEIIDFKYVDSFVGNITMYTLHPLECSKQPWEKGFGITASGLKVKPNFTVAMGKQVPFGTKIKIQGFDTIYTKMDTGNLIFWNCVDIYVTDRQKALEFGRQKRKVYILSWGTGKIK